MHILKKIAWNTSIIFNSENVFELIFTNQHVNSQCFNTVYDFKANANTFWIKKKKKNKLKFFHFNELVIFYLKSIAY